MPGVFRNRDEGFIFIEEAEVAARRSLVSAPVERPQWRDDPSYWWRKR